MNTVMIAPHDSFELEPPGKEKEVGGGKCRENRKNDFSVTYRNRQKIVLKLI